MQIRRTDEADLDLLARMRAAFVADHRGVDPTSLPPSFVQRTREFFAEGLRSGRVHSVLAEEAGVPVGIVSFVLDERPPQVEDPRTFDALVINMHVVASHRSRGIGRALLDAALALATDLGARSSVLIATDLGRPLYEAVGFATRPDWMHRAMPPA